MSTLSWPDVIILAIITISILIGLLRGLIKESISLCTWIVAIVIASIFTQDLAKFMIFTKVALIQSVVAFFLIFVGVVFVGALLNFIIGGVVRKTPFSAPDRVLGGVFGLARGFVVVALLILIGGLTAFPETKWWQESQAISHIQVISIWFKNQLPEDKAKVFDFAELQNISNSNSENISIESNDLEVIHP